MKNSFEYWNTLMKKFGDAVNANVRKGCSPQKAARRAAKKLNLKIKEIDYDRWYLYMPGCERVLDVTFRVGGMHIDLCYNPANAFLDEYDMVIVA